jgi:hypothetical protein
MIAQDKLPQNPRELVALLDYATKANDGYELIDMRALGILPIVLGGAQGYNSEADVVTSTVDGVDLNQIWTDYRRTLDLLRDQREPYISSLTFATTASFDQVGTTGTGSTFEEASEFGEPVGLRLAGAPVLRGYGFKWYDLAARYTWRFLLKATQAQLDAINDAAIEADNRLVFDRVMRTVFNPTNGLNAEGQVVHKFWNGVSVNGEAPPTWKQTSFTATHNHYLASNVATLAAKGDVAVPNLGLEDMYEHLRHHGYSIDNGYRVVAMMNSAQTALVRSWRANVDPGPGVAATYDFIPAVGQPGLLLGATAQPVGVSQVSANVIPGLNVIGSYGNILIVEDDIIPASYVFMYATGGTDSLSNPIAIREDPRLRGMQLVKGRTPDYPLIDSFYTHGLGTGVKNKGGGVVMQIVASTTYTAPAAYATP